MVSLDEKVDKKLAWITRCMEWASQEGERERQEEKDIDEMNEEQERQRAEEQPAAPTDVDDSDSGCPTEWLELVEREKTERRSPLAQTPSTQTDSFDLEVQQEEEAACRRRQSGYYLPIESCQPFFCWCGSCKWPGKYRPADLEWTCGNCTTINPGDSVLCLGCRNMKDKDEEVSQMEPIVLVPITPTDPVQHDWTPTEPVQHDCWGEEDAAALAKAAATCEAAAAAEWNCGNCTSINPASLDTCAYCKYPKDEDEEVTAASQKNAKKKKGCFAA